MLNSAVGALVEMEGHQRIATAEGAAGHAVYGDYDDYPAGRYAVEFVLAAADGHASRKDVMCAQLDVVVGYDTVLLATRDVLLSDLRNGPARFVLTFRLERPGRLQCRVAVNGLVPLLIDDHRPMVALPDTGDDPDVLLDRVRFPDPFGESAPAFLKENAYILRHLYERGVDIAIVGGDVVLRTGGVSFLARTPDDFSFVGEVFFDKVYNLLLPDDSCVIDVGMNIGLVSLLLATRAEVKEVHAFEPFEATYRRALANLAINPELATKIVAHNVGLSDRDEAGIFTVPDMDNSGAMTIRPVEGGTPVALRIRDAATALRPIIEQARARNRKVVIKVDCEGSEFALFRSLEQAGLLGDVSAFMVEWHRVFDGKTQADLIRPLLANGFVVFDRSARNGNGFFYGVRASGAPAAAGLRGTISNETITTLDSPPLPAAMEDATHLLPARGQRPRGSAPMKWMSRLVRRFAPTPPPPEPATVTVTAEDHHKLNLLLALLNEQSQPNINALTVLTRNLDVLSLTVKSLGYDLARKMADALPVRGDTRARHVGLACKASTQIDLESDWVAHWCGELKIPVIFHRKLWELAYVLQAVFENGHLRPGARGLGFGCGTEPMPSYFAAHGVSVMATDLPPEDSRAQEWAGTQQYTGSLDQAYQSHLVSRDLFDEHVRFRPVDMTAIPDDLLNYDFCWSMCALEHLGSIEKGLEFIENSLATLRPGGMAVHTLEHNINADGPTIDNWPTVLFQRKHLEKLATRLRERGHHVAPFDFDTGSKPLDHFIDLPPWHDGTFAKISMGLGQPQHLKVGADGFISTCFAMVVVKAG